MISVALVAFLLLQVPANAITVDGPDLKTRYAAAIKLAAAQRGPFWVANTFSVRPGVAFATLPSSFASRLLNSSERATARRRLDSWSNSYARRRPDVQPFDFPKPSVARYFSLTFPGMADRG